MADIIISNDDLQDPMIDDILNLQKSVQSRIGERLENIKTPLYYNPVFYYSVAATLGAFVVWAISEPFFRDDEKHIPFIGDYLLFGPVAGVMGLAIGLVYGASNRNLKQLLYCGIVGAGVGLGVTVLTTFIAEMLYGLFTGMAVAFAHSRGQIEPDKFTHFRGLAFFIHMSGRSIAWSIVSMGAGLGLGIALKSKKLLLNGFVGGMVGGFLGGLFFDPIDRFLPHAQGSGWLSRMVGIALVGLFVGFFIGLFENLSKEAWFLMLKGPLTGKQFIIFKSPILIGSSPKSDIYLFKDADIAPLHASVSKTGSKYLLKDEGSAIGTYVNGRRIDKYILQPNDTVTVSGAVLRYSEKQRKA